MRLPHFLAVLALAAVLAAGCGRSSDAGPVLGVKDSDSGAAQRLGFPGFATKNTTRVGGHDPAADAAAVARAVFPAASRATRPAAVALADGRDWRGALAASVLMAPPLRAPVLLADGDGLPDATEGALSDLSPRGSALLERAKVVRVGDVPKPDDLQTIQAKGRNPFAVAAAVDRLASALRGTPSPRVVVVSADSPEYAMPAAAWAAKAGDPILFVRQAAVPPETRTALAAHTRPTIYVLGPPSAVGAGVVTDLQSLGRVVRVSGSDPARNAIEFARFTDGQFGWGVVDPGHGFVFANTSRPADAAAAAALSASGTYGPLLLTDSAEHLPPAVKQYLLDVQPGYGRDPVRGVYNHGWLVGDESAISISAQSRIDTLLEIVPVKNELSR
jgi:Cell wall binding domain 2 (CWB2)